LAETIDQPISAPDDCIVLQHIYVGRREPPPFLPKQTVDPDVLKLPGSRYLPHESGLATPGIADMSMRGMGQVSDRSNACQLPF
jgi:hypothetical protein